MNWLKRLFTPKNQVPEPIKSEDFLDETVFEDGTVQYKTTDKHGLVDGNHHYTNCVETIKQLKREGKHVEAIELLEKTVDATERESKKFGKGWGVAPWYYEQLAIIYRKENMYDKEVAILERYQSQEKAPGVSPEKLKVRLEKAKQLLEQFRLEWIEF